jgi:hypothetical protein
VPEGVLAIVGLYESMARPSSVALRNRIVAVLPIAPDVADTLNGPYDLDRRPTRLAFAWDPGLRHPATLGHPFHDLVLGAASPAPLDRHIELIERLDQVAMRNRDQRVERSLGVELGL